MATTAGGNFLKPLFRVSEFAVGTAIGPLLRPTVQDLINYAWSQKPVHPLSAETAAALWVEGTWTKDRAGTEASYTGVSTSRLEALHDLLDEPPALALLYQLWRRGEIDVAQFNEGMRHLKIEAEYFEPLRGLRQVILSPAQLAEMRQQGYIDVARQHAESALSGIDAARADLMFEAAGLPPGPETALTMLRRNIITEAEFGQMIREGNTKTKYVDEYLALRHPLLTATQYVNLRLRGWIDDAEMNEKGAALGYSVDQMHDLFLGQGRPISTRQVFIGQRRGGVYNGPSAGIDPAILKQLQESNIRPEWYNLADAQKESYPSAFVIRQLATSGALDPTQTHRILMEIGWPEWLIDAVVEAWTGGTTDTATAGPRVKSAQTSAITEIRAAYLLGQADETQARDWLGRIAVEADEIDGMIPVWDVMREVPQKDLTATQIKKASKSLPSQWPRARALEALQLQGLTADDAATFLDS